MASLPSLGKEVRIADRGQCNVVHPILKMVLKADSYLNRQPGLPGTPGPGESDGAHRLTKQEQPDGLEVLLSPDQLIGLGGQIARTSLDRLPGQLRQAVA